jgi:TRAP-type C4-dicarboxylate transport system substrate-binding protein
VSTRAWPAVVTALLIAVIAGCGGSGSEGSTGKDGASTSAARYRDAVGDGGSLPDIRRIDVTSTTRGRISFRVGLANFSKRTRTVVDVWLDTDADPQTGNTSFEGADGADSLISVFLGLEPSSNPYCAEITAGGGCFSKWTPSGWTAATASSARVSRTAAGFTLSVNRRDLGNTEELNFFAVRGAEAPGFPDRAPGRGTYSYSFALRGPRPADSREVRDGADKAGGDEGRKAVVLTLGNHDYLQTDPTAATFVAAVRRLSGGSVKLDVREGWRFYDLDYERATIDDVVHRDLDLALVGARAWDNAGVTSFRALLAPFLIDSFPYEQRVLESQFVERMLEGVERRGLVGLAVLPGVMRRPLGVSRPLVRPRDYEQAAMAIRAGGVARATFRALGSSSSTFRGEQLSAFDGSELDVTTILNNRYDLHARALTANVVLWPRPTTLVMNRKAYDALNSDQQELLRDAARETFEPLLETLRSEEGTSLAALCHQGHFALVTATPADRAALRRAVQPVYDQLGRDSITRELIDEIEHLRAGLPPSEPLRCPKGRPTASRTALDGGWRADLDAEALAAAGASKEEVELVEGPITLEFDAGRWVAHMARSAAVFRGTYSLDTDVVRLTVDSCVPTKACTLDQVTEYRWSVYRDKLSLSRSRRYVFPALVAKPWTRAR